MSTNDSGDAALIGGIMADAKAMIAARAAEEEQLSLLDPVSPEEMVIAREELGENAGRYAVVQRARENRRGRPPGARNKRTDDFARYLLSFGQHPAVTMMQIQATQPELLIEASQQTKVHSFRKDGTPNVVIERMTFAEAQALRVRCAEGLLPYLESKKPVAVDMTFTGVGDLHMEGFIPLQAEASDILDADFAPVEDEGGA